MARVEDVFDVRDGIPANIIRRINKQAEVLWTTRRELVLGVIYQIELIDIPRHSDVEVWGSGSDMMPRLHGRMYEEEKPVYMVPCLVNSSLYNSFFGESFPVDETLNCTLAYIDNLETLNPYFWDTCDQRYFEYLKVVGL